MICILLKKYVDLDKQSRDNKSRVRHLNKPYVVKENITCMSNTCMYLQMVNYKFVFSSTDYYKTGFLALQMLIDNAIINEQEGGTTYDTFSVYMQKMPYIAHVSGWPHRGHPELAASLRPPRLHDHCFADYENHYL